MTVIYITESKKVGYRKQRFDWGEGDRIRTEDGCESATIVKVVESSQENLRYLNTLMNRIKRYNSGVPVKRTKDFGFMKAQVTVGYNHWSSVDAMIRYFERSIEKLK